MEFREMMQRVKGICCEQSACTYCPIYDPEIKLCLLDVEPDLYSDEWFNKVEHAVSLGKQKCLFVYPTWGEILGGVVAGPVAGGHMIIDLNEEIPKDFAKRVDIKPRIEWRMKDNAID